ncbi:hypothetical protein RchiOBHm_Chr5g0026271 [Rosa chinensis]|uniref:Uncharacterized protein n=1 Tax=Rosa chinensis TaxID=74649 RepID=A0A2P6Q8T9_ROSCH|nr:hypothetical protein RchiOBHm_Chr5g0026271 [Rosa chinensis]
MVVGFGIQPQPLRSRSKKSKRREKKEKKNRREGKILPRIDRLEGIMIGVGIGWLTSRSTKAKEESREKRGIEETKAEDL